MAKIAESLERLSVENNKNRGGRSRGGGEFVASASETVSKSSGSSGSEEQNYILGICGTQSDPDFRLGVALADHKCVIYTAGADRLVETTTLRHNDSPIVGIKFSHGSRNVVYTASSCGGVAACDLRAKGKVVAEFKDNTEEKVKTLASFDLSCDERLIACGTEHVGGDAFILFWDVRCSSSSNKASASGKDNLLGGYWESHQDDVTALAFHARKRDALATGGTDGLINVFDLTQTSEDAALRYSLNTESSVDRIGWLANDHLWCTTHTHALQLWNCEDATPYSKYERSDIPLSQVDDPDNCYLVRIHAPSTFGHPFLLAGSSSNKGEILECLSFGKSELEPYHSVTGNKQLVRDSWLHEKSGCLVTGGEAGILNVWRQSESLAHERNESGNNNSSNKRQAKMGSEKSRNEKNHRVKPY